MNDCTYLHSPSGPGCPFCMTTAGSAVALAAVARAELIAAGLTPVQRGRVLFAWPKPAGGAS